jgi:hypothetical protein
VRAHYFEIDTLGFRVLHDRVFRLIRRLQYGACAQMRPVPVGEPFLERSQGGGLDLVRVERARPQEGVLADVQEVERRPERSGERAPWSAQHPKAD